MRHSGHRSLLFPPLVLSVCPGGKRELVGGGKPGARRRLHLLLEGEEGWLGLKLGGISSGRLFLMYDPLIGAEILLLWGRRGQGLIIRLCVGLLLFITIYVCVCRGIDVVMYNVLNGPHALVWVLYTSVWGPYASLGSKD